MKEKTFGNLFLKRENKILNSKTSTKIPISKITNPFVNSPNLEIPRFRVGRELRVGLREYLFTVNLKIVNNNIFVYSLSINRQFQELCRHRN